MNLDTTLAKQLSSREKQSQTRLRYSRHSAQADRISVNGKDFINFSSNDYLGLANSFETTNLIKEQVSELGFGSGASHLISGHHQMHDLLESDVANYLNRQAALTFSTGYMANLAILQSLTKKGELIVADKLNHASLIDGCKLSDADSKRYPHCDLHVLETRLKRSAGNKWVVTDGVFSMDGDLAPLDNISALCNKYQATLIVDDAHGIGVLGSNGGGCAEYFGLSQSQLPILMGTFGKALGGFGAFVSGSRTLIDYLVQFARSYVYTTALPSIVAAGNRANLKQAFERPELRLQLKENIEYFRTKCEQNGVHLFQSNTAIQPVFVGDSDKLLELDRALKSKGIMVGAIRPPTVAPNSDRLRITISAAHKFEQIDRLVAALSDL